MALTPQDVQNKVFSPTRFRTGYNEDEVDTFLDEVEAELTRLLDENADTRRQLDEARRTGGGGPGVPPQLLEENQQLRRQLDDARRAAAQAQAAAQQAQAQAQAAAARGPSTSPVPIPGGATQVMPAVGQRGGGVPAPANAGAQLDAEIEQRVARTLVLAQRTADEALREARAESERARREARSDADRILAEARAHVAEQLGGLEEDKRRLEGQVEQLRAFEREYRTRLRAYLEMQLRDLDGMPTQPAVGPGGPARPGLNPGTQGGGQQQPQQPQPAAVGVPAGAYQPGPPAMGGQNGVNHGERDPRAGGIQEF